MSLDTMVDNPGIRSGDRGTWAEDEEQKRVNHTGWYSNTDTPEQKGGKVLGKYVYRLMRKRRCENKTRESHQNKRKGTQGDSREIH